MVKLAIRDDDTNYFTNVGDLDKLIYDLDGFPISFAVIPTVTDVSTLGRCSDTKGNTIPRYIGDNKEVTDWLRDKVANGKCDILLHGITHGYIYRGNKRLPEMVWRADEPNIAKQLLYWKNDLSHLFSYDVSCFVAPSNIISKKCLKAVADSHMNFSGIVPLSFNRELTLRNLLCYTRRWYYRFYSGLPFPGVLSYSTHNEINACTLRSKEFLITMFNYCEKHKLPMVINTHYWSLRDNKKQFTMLLSFLEYARKKGIEPVKVSDLLK